MAFSFPSLLPSKLPVTALATSIATSHRSRYSNRSWSLGRSLSFRLSLISHSCSFGWQISGIPLFMVKWRKRGFFARWEVRQGIRRDKDHIVVLAHLSYCWDCCLRIGRLPNPFFGPQFSGIESSLNLFWWERVRVRMSGKRRGSNHRLNRQLKGK